jgi:hypothetical protein
MLPYTPTRTGFTALRWGLIEDASNDASMDYDVMVEGLEFLRPPQLAEVNLLLNSADKSRRGHDV